MTTEEMLLLFHDDIRYLNDELCKFFDDYDFDSPHCVSVTQKLCEASFWLSKLYNKLLDDIKENQSHLTIVKKEKIGD